MCELDQALFGLFLVRGRMLPWQWGSLYKMALGVILCFSFLTCFISSVILGAFWKLSQKSDNDPYGCLGLGSPTFLTAMLISQRGTTELRALDSVLGATGELWRVLGTEGTDWI